MKNHRAVCAARDAGFVEYSGLPGKVKTGCMNTPKQKSKYCSLHSCADENDVGIQGKVIEMVLSKKTTRNNTFYLVCF